MKKRVFALGVTVAIAAAILSGCGSGGSDEIKVGAIFNTTGYMAPLEEPSSNGFMLAIEEINAAGGIAGKKINCTNINAQSDVNENVSAMTKLIDVDKALVVAGIDETNMALPAGTVAQERKVPFLCVGSTQFDFEEKVGDYGFLVPFGDNIQSYALAEFSAKQLGAKTACILYDSTAEYTVCMQEFFAERFEEDGGKVLLIDSYDENGKTDFSAFIDKILALDEKPDVILCASLTDQAPSVITQLRTKGLDMPILGGDAYDATSIIDIAGTENTNNVYFSTHVALGQNSDNVKNFNAAYEEKYGCAPESGFAALGYDAAYLIKYAIENEMEGELTSENIQAALRKVTDFQGVTGTISYESGNVPLKSATIIEFVNGEMQYIDSVTPRA